MKISAVQVGTRFRFSYDEKHDKLLPGLMVKIHPYDKRLDGAYWFLNLNTFEVDWVDINCEVTPESEETILKYHLDSNEALAS